MATATRAAGLVLVAGLWTAVGLAAVLSVSGLPLPRLAPSPTLGGGVAGWRFHQFVMVPSGDPVGTVVALGPGISDPVPCWVPDGRAVIYGDAAFTHVSVIRAPQ